MDILLQICLMILMLVISKVRLNTYTFLILLQSVSFFSQFLVGYSNEVVEIITIFNMLFICTNLFLIIAPWRYGALNSVFIQNSRYFYVFKKALYPVLILNMVVNIAILVIVYMYIPDIAAFKSESAYLNLYESIPYFANVFRYAYVSQNLGFLAIPIFFYYLGKGEKRKARWALILSSSSLISAFAFYSRALMLTYMLIFVAYFLLIKGTLNDKVRRTIWGFIKKTLTVVGVLFVVITVIRFSAMDYYGDRIPQSSLIKDPIVYSLIDYTSQGYPKGLVRMNDYHEDKNLKGQDIFRSIYQFLGFFGVISWNAEVADEQISKAYSYDGGAFKGYTAHMVYNFGFTFTFLISICYYIYVKVLLRKKSISIESLFILVLLLIIPLVSIFYSGLGNLYFPLIFIGIIKLTYRLKKR